MATVGQAEIKTNYPVVQGLEADEKHDGEENNLIPEISLVDYRQEVGLN